MGNAWGCMKAHHRQEKLNFSGLFFNRFFNLGYNFFIIFSTFFAYNFLRDTSEFFINGMPPPPPRRRRQQIQRHISFLCPKCPICRKQEYYEKAIYIILIYLFSLCSIQKSPYRSCRKIGEIVTHQFCTQNRQPVPNISLQNLLINTKLIFVCRQED